ncbi:MAG: hypothetical protein INR73_28500 [Williamsia sp.]|nr:hypothetical protein [Williamsia sp.]
MTADNADDKYTTLIDLLTAPNEAVKTELGDVASSLAFQKGRTKTNDQVLSDFIDVMRRKRGVIADALGGEEAPEYLAFYPQGIKQYNGANKTNMPTLTQQVAKAAKTFDKEIGATLATLLQSFPQQWEESRSSQQQQKGDVKDNRTDRTANRVKLELALCAALHTIGQMYPAQVEKCLSLFSFSMLYPQTRRKHETFSNASLAPSATDTVLNRTLTDTYEITIRNTDDNAPIAAWLAPNETAAYPGKGIEVQPGKTVVAKPSKLGDLANTFLRIINLSDVNDGSYEVDIS